MATRARRLFAPVLEYLREAGEIRSASDIESHFSRSFGVGRRDDGVRIPVRPGLMARRRRLCAPPSAARRRYRSWPSSCRTDRMPTKANRSRGAGTEDERRCAPRLPCRARASTTSRTSRWRFRATAWSSSPGSRAPASRAWPSTRSTPRGSADTWSRSRATPSASSPRWPSPTSTSCSGCRRSFRSSRRRSAATRDRRSAR